MIIRLDTSTPRQTRWSEYVLRFVFGGLVTAAAGVIADKFGPSIGGLFLAFPAIFPASATLIEKHEREKKQRQGLNGTQRGRDAAALLATGSALACAGLLLFGALVWMALPNHRPWLVLSAATVVWALASSGLWLIRRRS